MWPTYSYASADSTLADALDRLAVHIEQVPNRLSGLSAEEWQASLPGKWSKKEIVGHLIDSAINNLKRFTDAQFGPEVYLFTSYQQNALVEVNHYQQLPVDHLLTLWQSLNRQILYVTSNLSDALQQRKVMLAGSNGEPRPLSWLIEDYVAHLEHHLKTL